MGWWSSVINGVKAISSTIATGIKWTWNHIPLTSATVSVLKFAAKTSYHNLAYVMASRTAIPDLFEKPRHREIALGLGRIVYYDILPVVIAYNANLITQNYLRAGHENDPWSAPYSAVLGTLSVVDYAVKSYCLTKGVVATFHTAILLGAGGMALNSHKVDQKSPLCVANKCNEKRFLKGSLREFFIVNANNLLVDLIKRIPYIGQPASFVFKVIFQGRVITRIVTPERCDRHKAMVLWSVLSLGLSQEGTQIVVDWIMARTVGLPPFLYYRVLCNIILLLNINMAAHMEIPLAEPQADAWPDPFNAYEEVCRFIADVVMAGLMKEIPRYFKAQPDEPPLIPLIPTLQQATKLLNSDLQGSPPEPTTRLKKIEKVVGDIVVPKSFRTMRGFTNDPIISIYLPRIRNDVITGVTAVESVGKSSAAKALAWSPNVVARAVRLKFGVPKKITLFVLMLTQEKDFWNFTEALRLWFVRHGVDAPATLAPRTPQAPALSGSTKLLPFPEADKGAAVAQTSATDLATSPTSSTTSVPGDFYRGAKDGVPPQTFFAKPNPQQITASTDFQPRRRLAAGTAVSAPNT